MKRFNLFAVIALVTVFAFTSCKEKAEGDAAATTDTAAATAPAADPNAPVAVTPGTDPTAAVAPATPVPTGPTTTLKFDEETYDWGKVMDGDKVTHVFKFKNTGNEPLIISNAKGSCGCTVPEWPKEPVAPGAEATIRVKFNSAGKEGEQNKTVTLQVNTVSHSEQLLLNGFVRVPKKEK